MATLGNLARSPILALGGLTFRAVLALGDWSLFVLQTFAWLPRRLPARGAVVPIFYYVGVRSVLVVMITGGFIGMVMAVQSYAQFHKLGLDNRLGQIINLTLIRELGPVLAATMLAGRVGSAMAAELATMRITEQIDALAVLGINPVHYLVVPRFLACFLLIPLLTIVADFMGVVGGYFMSTRVFEVDPHYYWHYSQQVVGLWDLLTSLLKAMFFGAAIALVSCHRGFRSGPGAEGVGRAATEAFVLSFIAILVLDLFLGMFLNTLHERLYPEAAGLQLM